MSQHFDVEDWEQSFKTSTRSGMMRNGIVSPLPTLVRRIKGIGFGSLPTVVAREGKDMMRLESFQKIYKKWGDKRSGVTKSLVFHSMTTPTGNPQIGLNPCFAEWMLKVPVGWTDLNK